MLRIDVPGDFGFREEHELLRGQARRLLAERCPISEVRRLLDDPLGHDPALWKELGELGWVGLVLPEADGGADLGHLHLALLLEETGRCLLPGPYLACVLAGFALAEAGSREQRARWAAPLAAGESIATLAAIEPEGFEPRTVTARAEPVQGGFVLRGRKIHVPAAPAAQLLIAPCRERDGGLGLYALDLPRQGVAIEPELGVDATRRTGRVTLDDVRVPREARLEGDGARALARALTRGFAALAAEMVGGAEATLGMTRDYAVERKQFGRQIGGFQAVKHPLVDVMIGVELARTHAYAAAAALDRAPDAADTAARMAKASAGDAFSFAVGRAVQLHGGYGFTWECDAHLYFRRALWSRAMLGDAAHHRRILAARLLPEVD